MTAIVIIQCEHRFEFVICFTYRHIMNVRTMIIANRSSTPKVTPTAIPTTFGRSASFTFTAVDIISVALYACVEIEVVVRVGATDSGDFALVG